MQIETHNGLRDAQKSEASRVVVYDRYGNPLLVAIELENGHTIASMAGEKDFLPILRNLGINKTLVVDDITPKPLDEI